MLIAAALAGPARGAEALYLANEGVLVRSGETTVLFDPLFDDSYGQYQLLPDPMQAAIFSGEPPFDNVGAVFVSHAHGDHFSARLMLDYLRVQPGVRLYAPAQAIAAMRNAAEDRDRAIFERVTGIAIDSGDEALDFVIDAVAVTVMRVPHSGWPNRMADIENLVFRVTLEDDVTVAHFGDADPDPDHFAVNAESWKAARTDLAMPPYWFFLSDGGLDILENIVGAADAIGVHVPVSISDDPNARQTELRGHDLFTVPGQTRPLP